MDKDFSSLNFRHSISITHHSSLKIPCLFSTITHFPSLNIFHTICGLHTCHWCRKKKKKKKKNESQRQPRKRKKKKSKGGQKLRLWVFYVCLITILPLSYELWKLKIVKSCFSVSITHKSKIRELSDGNRVMVF